VFSKGNSAVESLCAAERPLMGRVSVADTSLSLSLSLWPARPSSAKPARRARKRRRAIPRRGVGFVRPAPPRRAAPSRIASSASRAASFKVSYPRGAVAFDPASVLPDGLLPLDAISTYAARPQAARRMGVQGSVHGVCAGVQGSVPIAPWGRWR
jgi:hypothetical protein